MKYTKEVLEEAVKNSDSVMDVVRYLNVKYSGGTYCHINNLIKRLEIDKSHFNSKPKVYTGGNKKKHWSEILVNNTDKTGRCERSKYLHKALIEYGAKYVCNRCDNNGKWLDNDLTLHVHHLNEVVEDNRPENLVFLCPNCHEQHHLLERKSKPRIKCKRDTSKSKPPTYITKELLESLIIDINIKDIAKQYNVSRTSVQRWFKYYKINYIRRYQKQ